MKNTGTLKVTTPELLKRWYGPRGWSLVTCEVGFRFVLRGPDGQEMGMRGVYRESCHPRAPSIWNRSTTTQVNRK